LVVTNPRAGAALNLGPNVFLQSSVASKFPPDTIILNLIGAPSFARTIAPSSYSLHTPAKEGLMLKVFTDFNATTPDGL
ncbi:hypothetical protein, partial [Enterobacter hormaechei]|uniref:hypothetical protein n=1 Tax=Enterobacter hormaechei TaxID=158836 RepID=UPI001953AC78